MSTRETTVPAIPAVTPENLQQVAQSIKSALDVREGRLGDPLDQFITLRELKALGMVQEGGSTSMAGVGGTGTLPVVPGGGFGPEDYDGDTDLTTPPGPTQLIAEGLYSSIYLSWAGNNYRNHAYTEIWRNSIDELGSASLVGSSIGSQYYDEVGTEKGYYYWVRFVSRANVKGPYNLTSGTYAKTALDVLKRIDILREEILNDPLTIELGTRISNAERSLSLNANQLAALNDARNQLQQQIASNGSGLVRLDRVTADQASSITLLGTKLGLAESSITELLTTTSTQAQALTTLNTSLGEKNKVFFQAAEPASNTAYTLKAGDLWYDTDDSNKSYRWSGTAWTAFVNASKVYFQSEAPASSEAAPLFTGDLWYDSDDNNHPYRWSGSAWTSMRDGFINARVTTLEQTKIGYATLDATGRVFDNNGTIIDKAGVDAWNTANPTNKATWNQGLPLATAVKQVAVSDGADSLTLEERFTAQKGTNSQLLGQYTVKIDNKGHVSGFGLSSATVDGTPSSAFIVRADRFALVGPEDSTDPLGTLTPTNVPFVVLTTQQTIGGLVYPPGVWMKSAFIADATITNAKIKDLAAGKITTGTISVGLGGSAAFFTNQAVTKVVNDATVAKQSTEFKDTWNAVKGYYLGDQGGTFKFYVGNGDNGTGGRSLEFDGTNVTVRGTIYAYAGEITDLSARNFTVYDNQNRVILSSSGYNNALISIASSQVSDLGALATQDSVSYSDIGGTKPPADATRNVVFRQASAPTTGVTANDLWFNTTTKATYYWSGTAWVLAGDVTSQNTAKNIVGQGALAKADSVFVGSTVKFPNGTTLNTGDFVNTLTKISTGNISTFIDGLAVTNAYIGSIDAEKITTGYLAADRIEAGSITASKIDTKGLEIKDANGNVILRSGSTPINALSTFNAIQRWNFDNSSIDQFGKVDGFTLGMLNVNLLPSSIELFSQGDDPTLQTPDSLGIDGTLYNKIQLRIKRKAGTGWDGSVYYRAKPIVFMSNPATALIPTGTTITIGGANYVTVRPTPAGSAFLAFASVSSISVNAAISGPGVPASTIVERKKTGHDGSYLEAYAKRVFPDPTLLNTWVNVEWDMETLNNGSTDWKLELIDQISFHFGTTIEDVFEIDWIAVGRYVSGGVDKITPENASTFIADLAVNTLQIAGNAVTVPTIARNYQVDNINKVPKAQVLTNWQEILTVEADFGAAAPNKVLVGGNVNVLAPPGVSYTATYMRMKNKTTGEATNDVGVAHQDSVVLTNLNMLNGVSGKNIFALEISQEDTGGSTYLAVSKSITVMGAKR